MFLVCWPEGTPLDIEKVLSFWTWDVAHLKLKKAPPKKRNSQKQNIF